MSQQSYTIPATVDEALALAHTYQGHYKYLAGGTDVQIHRLQGLMNAPHLIDLSDIEELHEIAREGDELHIGAMVTLAELPALPLIVSQVPLVAEAAQSVATPVIRKTATVGGNLLVENRCVYYDQSEEWRTSMGSCLRDVGDICLVTGSKPNCYSRNVSDLAPALIALDATVTIRSRQKTHSIPVIDLYASDGLHPHSHRDDDSIISGIRVPLTPRTSWFRKLRLRRSMDFTSLTIAASVDETDYARVCINGVSMAPVLLQGRISDLALDTLQRQARKACQTVENDLMPLKYRREIMGVYLEEWWDSIHTHELNP